ncbi:universal stress protein [Mycobacterium spongiae]|uniref:Universal stress protein n=1 Tax=Mycobacterium spongiae TaxID=886343 RepID=A0A975JYR1_9MYCO|nr:universal stress protein [Mycobacterium spongiae]QUR68169.1 universal stress protein [Mycobacterium spongiae]
MSVVVGYRTGEVGLSGLHLGIDLARTLHTSLTVVTIVPQPWPTPSLARIDAEYEQWADQLAADSAAEARGRLDGLADGIDVTYQKRAHRSVSAGLIELATELEAQVLVLGSVPHLGVFGGPTTCGGVLIGSTADRLLHSAPMPLAISPHGYRSRTGAMSRITCGYSATAEGADVVRRCVKFAREYAVPVRVVTFAVRGRTMYPSEVGLHSETTVLEVWAAQAREMLEKLRTEDVVDADVALDVVTGNGWKQALASANWTDGEILALGTSPRGKIARVFLGSHSGKIVRHSPVPVLVLPG